VARDVEDCRRERLLPLGFVDNTLSGLYDCNGTNIAENKGANVVPDVGHIRIFPQRGGRPRLARAKHVVTSIWDVSPTRTLVREWFKVPTQWNSKPPQRQEDPLMDAPARILRAHF
jgi:hypothetical protein